MLYKEMSLKDKLPTMSEEEQYALLATDGMLVKRPLVIGEDYVLTGFREKEWDEKIRYWFLYKHKSQQNLSGIDSAGGVSYIKIL